jgi:TRAP-type uncharacterized transport system substrate-binding protein
VQLHLSLRQSKTNDGGTAVNRLGRRTILLVVCAGILAGLFATGKWAIANLRYPITFASPANYSFADFGSKVSRVLADERPVTRLQRVPVQDLIASAAALEERKVDLAIVRTDLKLPSNGQTVAIFGRDPAFLIVPAKSEIESFLDLKGKSIAILGTGIDETALLDRLLGVYAVPPASVARKVMNHSEIGDAIRQKRIAAVFAVTSPTGAPAIDAFAAVARAGKGTPDLIGLPEGDAIAKRYRDLESAEIPQGAFTGASPRPEEGLQTVFVTYRLMARETMSDMIVGELTRMLMVARGRLLSTSPIAARIEEPDADTDTVPIHPGAKAYFNDEQVSLFDRIESTFWMGTAVISVLGSAIAWVISRLRGRTVAPADLGKHLLAILRKVRAADRDELGDLEGELEDVVVSLVEMRTGEQFGNEELATLSFAVLQVREALRKRWEAVDGKPAARPSLHTQA